jgi:hypothetical protein
MPAEPAIAPADLESAATARAVRQQSPVTHTPRTA